MTRALPWLAVLTIAPLACASEPADADDTASSDSGSGPSSSATTTSPPTTSTTQPGTESSSESTADTGSSESGSGSTTDASSSESSGDPSSESGSSESSTGGAATYELLDPLLVHFGQTYQEWAAAWWQWCYGLPVTGHPLFDDTGMNCTTGQSGEVFFLAGTFGGMPVMRTCTAPADTAIFLPIVNASWDNAGTEMADWWTEMELQDGVVAFIDAVDDYSIEIDGDVYDMDALAPYRIGLYTSSYEVPAEDSIFDHFDTPVDVVGTVDPTFGDGVYVMIELEPGEHDIHVQASSMKYGFTVDVTYELTVE